MIRTSDLIGSTVMSAADVRIGRVAEIVVTRQAPHHVIALEIGAAGWRERMGLSQVLGFGAANAREPHRIPWTQVATFDGRTVTLKPDRERDARLP